MHVEGLPRAFDVPDDLDQQMNPLAWTRLQVSVVASILSAERMSVSLIAGSAFSDDASGAKDGRASCRGPAVCVLGRWESIRAKDPSLCAVDVRARARGLAHAS